MVRARRGIGRYYDVNGWLFVAPALGLITLFMIYPIAWSLWMSFQSGRGMTLKFAGFANIVRLWNDPVFIKALTNTMTYFVVQVPIMILLALILASLLNNPRLVGREGFSARRSSCPASVRWSPIRCSSRACSQPTGSSIRRSRRSEIGRAHV